MANERKSADAALNDSKNTLSDGHKTHSRLVQQIPNAITALALCSGLGFRSLLDRKRVRLRTVGDRRGSSARRS